MQLTRIVNSIYSSNTYILSDSNSSLVWLIDIGDIDPVIETLLPKQKIVGVFLTHTHFDHLYGINELITLFPDCTVYVSKYGKDGLYSDKLNLSRYYEKSFVFYGNNVKTLYEGDEIELFTNENLKVIETPGHDKSCLTYFTNQYIFTGDSLIPNIKLVANFPHSDKKQANTSVMKIISKADVTTLLCPGHDNVINTKDINLSDILLDIK